MDYTNMITFDKIGINAIGANKCLLLFQVLSKL